MAMAKKKNGGADAAKRGRGDRTEARRPKLNLHPETKKSVLSVVFFTFALILILSYFGGAGRAGSYIYSAFDGLFGIGYFIVPLTFLMILFLFFVR